LPSNLHSQRREARDTTGFSVANAPPKHVKSQRPVMAWSTRGIRCEYSLGGHWAQNLGKLTAPPPCKHATGPRRRLPKSVDDDPSSPRIRNAFHRGSRRRGAPSKLCCRYIRGIDEHPYTLVAVTVPSAPTTHKVLYPSRSHLFGVARWKSHCTQLDPSRTRAQPHCNPHTATAIPLRRRTGSSSGTFRVGGRGPYIPSSTSS